MMFVAHAEHKSPQMVGRFSPIIKYAFLFFLTHDALVCHVASTTEKTRLQTTRDRHMHPTVKSMCVSM